MRIKIFLLLIGAMLLDVSLTFAQPASIDIGSTKYFGRDYTIPSYTELSRCVRSAPEELQNAINNLKDKEMPYNIVMNIYGDPTTQMAFNWFTNDGVEGGKVQIVEGIASDEGDFETPLLIVDAACTQTANLNYNVPRNDLNNLARITDNTKKTYTENKALVSGLAPNTSYSFRVGKEGFWSEIGTFTTAKDNNDDFSFIYVTDTQPDSYDKFNKLQSVSDIAFQMASNKTSKPNFWIHCGDITESGTNSNDSSTSSEWEWEQFFEKQQNIFYKLPFAPVIGNHDNNVAKNFTNHFYTNNPSFDGKNKTAVPGSTYSFVYGDALFLALNSEACYNYGNYFYPPNSGVAYADSLIDWMTNEVVKHPDVKWRIVYYHSQIFSSAPYNNPHSNISTWRNKIAHILTKLNIDVVFEGHDHNYKVAGPVVSIRTDNLSTHQLVPETVTHQTIVTPYFPGNVNGKLGGTYNTVEGTLYFSNSSASEKKYCPDAINGSALNYRHLFTGRYGQPTCDCSVPGATSATGNPTFSNVTVTSDTITITTYEVLNYNSASIFDKIKIVKPISVTGVTLNETEITILAGASETLNATVYPRYATDKTITWSSSNPTVASVNNGTVSALKSGTATITAQAHNGIKAECELTVNDPFIEVSSILLDISTLSMTVGEEKAITATVLPENAMDQTVTWSSSEPSVASVSNGTVFALKAGKATITAQAHNGKKSECEVNVSDPIIVVTSVSLDLSTLSMEVGEEKKIKAIVLPENATDQTVTWSSSDPTVASVSNGTVFALKAGMATITAQAHNGIKAECEVNVSDPIIVVTSVSLDLSTLSMEVGEEKRLVATVLPENATDKTVTWSSTSTVVSVNNGVVFALKAGKAIITAQAHNGITAECEVTVKNVTGVEDIETSLVTVYPNPTDGQLILNFIQHGTYRVSVSTLDGKTLSTEIFTGQSARMDISGYQQGIYLLTVEDDKQKTNVKIVKE